MAEPQIYWHLTRSDPSQTLPVLERYVNANIRSPSLNVGTGIGAQQVYKGIQATNPIDVVNNFQWTKSPQTARFDVPTISLLEKRILMNSNVANLANSIFAAGTSIANLFGQEVSSLVEKGIDNGPDALRSSAGAIGNLPQTLSNNETAKKILGESVIKSDIVKAAAEAGRNTLNSISDYYTSFILSNNPTLKPYNFLYATEPTGFQYELPYFGNTYNSVSVSFGEAGEQNLLAGVTSIFETLAGQAAGIGGTLKPGTYIEKAKQFSMGSSGRTIDIVFPLLNTGEYKDIIENWQLIFGLIYQNRPGRVTRAIIDVPVIYEVKCPGVIYMPFAFINSLNVNFLGSRRKMSIDVPIGFSPGQTSTRIETIIPDAYEVHISLQGLNDETRNFLYTNVIGGAVTVS